MKTSTGKEITLKTPTMADRLRCNDAAGVEIKPDGTMITRNNYRALVEWAMVGTGLALEDLGKQYNDNEIREIGMAVKEAASISPLSGPD